MIKWQDTKDGNLSHSVSDDGAHGNRFEVKKHFKLDLWSLYDLASNVPPSPPSRHDSMEEAKARAQRHVDERTLG